MTTVTIDRDDAITAAGACAQAAEATRRKARTHRNAGPDMKHVREWLRECADQYEQAGKALQRAADES